MSEAIKGVATICGAVDLYMVILLEDGGEQVIAKLGVRGNEFDEQTAQKLANCWNAANN